MPSTYEPIAQNTLTGTATTITFSSIPSTYTDLRLVLFGRNTTSVSNVNMTFNGSSTAYYVQRLFGNGASATYSNSNYNTSQIGLNDSFNLQSNYSQSFHVDIFSYAQSVHKNVLITSSQEYGGTGEIGNYFAVWGNTATINTITLTISSNAFAIGTTASLYGILRA